MNKLFPATGIYCPLVYLSPQRGEGKGSLLTLTWNENKGDNWWYTCLQLRPFWLTLWCLNPLCRSAPFTASRFIRTLPSKFLLKTIIKASLHFYQVSLWLAYLCRLKTNTSFCYQQNMTPPLSSPLLYLLFRTTGTYARTLCYHNTGLS